MNKIVREHYPVSQLPEELRKEFEGIETVRLVVEEDWQLTGKAAIDAVEARYQEHMQRLGLQGTLDLGKHRGKTTIEEGVARIRALRDEWDDR